MASGAGIGRRSSRTAGPRRRRAAAIAGTITAALGIAGAASAAPACVEGRSFETGEALRAILVYTGADGVSHLKAVQIPGFSVPFFNTGKFLKQTVLGPSQKVVLVQGPANGTIPSRPGVGRVMFLTLSGSSTVVLPDGVEMTAEPGMLTIFDDAASKTGHGGRTGPCGYVALSIPLPEGAPTFAAQK